MTTSSPERLAANRANAQKSTGPRTPQGRAASRMNALKHGLLSQEVLICSPHRYESEEELFALHDRFRNELQPMGPLEWMLCDQIVTTHWRLRRVLAAESAEMALSLRRGRSQLNQQAESRSVQVGSKSYELSPPLEETAEGCQKAQRSLREIANAVQREGGLTEHILSDKSITQLTVLLPDLRAMLNRRVANPDGVEEKAWAEQHLTEVMEYLDNKIREMALLEETHYAAALMPDVEVLERFGRYEAMLNRQLTRAITQLTKLQKERRKEANASFSSASDLVGLPRLPRVPESPRSKPISDPLEQAREILRNKAKAPEAPVQSSRSKVQSSAKLRNEPIVGSAAVPGCEFQHRLGACPTGGGTPPQPAGGTPALREIYGTNPTNMDYRFEDLRFQIGLTAVIDRRYSETKAKLRNEAMRSERRFKVPSLRFKVPKMRNEPNGEPQRHRGHKGQQFFTKRTHCLARAAEFQAGCSGLDGFFDFVLVERLVQGVQGLQ